MTDVYSDSGYSLDSFSFSYLDGYDSDGLPSNILEEKQIYSDELHSSIAYVLAEGQDLRSVSPALFETEARATLHITELAEVFVSMYHEGAGYRNAIGFYSYNKDHPPTSPHEVDLKIAFPNFSFLYSGGKLTNGDKVSLGFFPGNTIVKFFLVANGWNKSRQKVLENSHGVVFSEDEWNLGDSLYNKQQVVMLWDNDSNMMVTAFEDILNYRGGDHDFNDAIFMISASPETAISTSNKVSITAISDLDDDGVANNIDAFPEDVDRAASNYYPSKDDFGIVAFEDLWPNRGDYDFNDLVVKYQSEQILNSTGKVKELNFRYQLLAMGAGYPNGLKLRLTIAKDRLKSLSITNSANELISDQLSSSDSSIVVTLIDNAKLQLSPDSGCYFSNTETECPKQVGELYTLTMVFKEPVDFQNSNLYSNAKYVLAPYDLFLFRTNDESLEIHRTGFSGTSRFDESRQNTGHDASSGDKTFATVENHSWVLLISSMDFKWPVERVNILQAYPDMKIWMESSGDSNTNWFKTNVKTNKVWDK